MSNELVLFDLASKPGPAWSPNVWKTRAVLNYKKIPYRTEWIEFPDIEPKFKQLGLPPNPQGAWADYTVPTVQFADGSYVMESGAINERLVKEYPEPALSMEPKLLEELNAINGEIVGPIFPALMPRARQTVVTPGSDEWFKKDRERRLGAPEEVYLREKGGEGAWKKAESGQQKLAAFLKKHKKDEGPFVLGSKVTYLDLQLAGWCTFMKYLGDDFYDRYVNAVEGLPELYEACQPYVERKH